jgi:hypothetical protein
MSLMVTAIFLLSFAPLALSGAWARKRQDMSQGVYL